MSFLSLSHLSHLICHLVGETDEYTNGEIGREKRGNGDLEVDSDLEGEGEGEGGLTYVGQERLILIPCFKMI